MFDAPFAFRNATTPSTLPDRRMITPTDSPRCSGASFAASSAVISPASTRSIKPLSVVSALGCFTSDFLGMAIRMVGPSTGAGDVAAAGVGPVLSPVSGGNVGAGGNRRERRGRWIGSGRRIGSRRGFKLDHDTGRRLVVGTGGCGGGRSGKKHGLRRWGWRLLLSRITAGQYRQQGQGSHRQTQQVSCRIPPTVAIVQSHIPLVDRR